MWSFLVAVEVGDIFDVTTKERLDGLDARTVSIESRVVSIETRLGIAISERKSAVARAYESVVNHKGTTSLIGLVAILGTVFGSNLYRRHLERLDRDFDNSVDRRIDAKLNPVSAKLEGVIERLATVEGKLDVLILQRAAARISDPNSAKQTSELLQEARKNGARLDAGLIAETGNKFIEATRTNPKAWDTALEFLNYRSSLNVYTRAVKTVNAPPGSVSFNLVGVTGKPLPELSHIPLAVAPGDAARFEIIGKNLNQQLQFGTAQLILTGGAINLDDMYIRHAIFDRVEIHYTGKTLRLQDAVFANCTFVFENTQPGRELGRALLASSPVSFEKTS